MAFPEKPGDQRQILARVRGPTVFLVIPPADKRSTRRAELQVVDTTRMLVRSAWAPRGVLDIGMIETRMTVSSANGETAPSDSRIKHDGYQYVADG